jgi:DNA-directed RNA polymerase
MIPFTEPVGDWALPHREDLNLDLISNVQADFLERMTPSVIPNLYKTVNKLQKVGYKVSTSIIPHIELLIADVRKKLSVYEGRFLTKPEMKVKKSIEVEKTMLEKQKRMLMDLDRAGTCYFAVTADYRGRLYYRGGILTPQGHDFQKAAFQFAEPRKLGKGGINGIAIHFANVAWDDKASINDRIKWARTEGVALAARVALGHWPAEADKPYQALVAALEWNRIVTEMNNGTKPSEMYSTLVCHQDGTCNGLQHGAAITGHRATAVAVNCVESTWDDVPSDVYRLAADAMYDACIDRELGAVAKAIRLVGRSAMKKPVMVTGYGAGTRTALEGMISKLEDHPDALAEIESNDKIVKEAMKEALEATAGAMVKLNEVLQASIMDIAEKPIYWTTADGFYVQQACRAKYRGEDFEDEREFYAKGTEFETRTDGINRQGQINAISPNFVHSIDATHLRMVIMNTDAQIAAVHDSIGSHAADFFEVARVIREQFIKVHKYNQIQDLATENSIRIDDVRLGDYRAEEALSSTYIFS